MKKKAEVKETLNMTTSNLDKFKPNLKKDCKQTNIAWIKFRNLKKKLEGTVVNKVN